ncbi:MAG: HAD-IA family hydrolase [Ignavibacteriaceae bacterium]|jgi:3-deoxy-D-manno-octulosonate 8-phosphate phosphatase (KDO 8-P phosphatase)|nr:HAD-IA family hydrolase [Ignavibacteriaceae bacterium]
MVIDKKLRLKQLHLKEKAQNIKMVLSDNDGVLTDTGVYYSEKGEVFKRFSIRDGMGVERLRNLLNIKTGIITGELSGSVKKRAKKLKIKELHLGSKDKVLIFKDILKRNKLKPENIAFIGDDVNDIEIMKLAGFTAAPNDALEYVKDMVDYVCINKGGNGAFREFAELIIALNIDEDSITS